MTKTKKSSIPTLNKKQIHNVLISAQREAKKKQKYKMSDPKRES